MSSKQTTGERICNVIKHTAFWLKTSHAGMEPVLTQSPTELEIKLKIKKNEGQEVWVSRGSRNMWEHY